MFAYCESADQGNVDVLVIVHLVAPRQAEITNLKQKLQSPHSYLEQEEIERKPISKEDYQVLYQEIRIENWTCEQIGKSPQNRLEIHERWTIVEWPTADRGAAVEAEHGVAPDLFLLRDADSTSDVDSGEMLTDEQVSMLIDSMDEELSSNMSPSMDNASVGSAPMVSDLTCSSEESNVIAQLKEQVFELRARLEAMESRMSQYETEVCYLAPAKRRREEDDDDAQHDRAYYAQCALEPGEWCAPGHVVSTHGGRVVPPSVCLPLFVISKDPDRWGPTLEAPDAHCVLLVFVGSAPLCLSPEDMADLLRLKQAGIDAESSASLNVYLRRGEPCLWRDEFGDELLSQGVVAFAEVSLVNTILEDGQLSFQGVPNSVCVMITHQINSKINEKLNALIARTQTRDETAESLRVFLRDMRQRINNSTLFTFSPSSNLSLFDDAEVDDEDEDEDETLSSIMAASETSELSGSVTTKHSNSSSKKNKNKGLQASIFKLGRDAKRQTKKLNTFASAVCDVVSKHTKEGVHEIKQAYDSTVVSEKKKKGR
jgi:hypothetical protein